MLKALQKLNLSWEEIKGKGVITVYSGKNKHEQVMNVFSIRKMLANKVIMAHKAKDFEYLLK
jgi:hypothetical protein